MRLIVITNCTARKAVAVPARQSASSLPRGTPLKVAAVWRSRLAEAEDRLPAHDLYLGRGFIEALAASRAAHSTLYIASAGLGLIPEDQDIPPYSLTVSPDQDDSIGRKAKPLLHPSDWWSALRKVGISKRTVAQLVRSERQATVVLALSKAYLELVSADLKTLSERQLRQIRIVGPRQSQEVDERFAPLLMPYDDRIDGRDSSIPGTESDFPQRAGRHLVGLLRHRKAGSPARDARLVSDALADWGRKVIPKRKRPSEKELVDAIRKALKRAGGVRTKALRMLRDKMNIACEQGRFNKICSNLSKRASRHGQRRKPR